MPHPEARVVVPASDMVAGGSSELAHGADPGFSPQEPPVGFAPEFWPGEETKPDLRKRRRTAALGWVAFFLGASAVGILVGLTLKLTVGATRNPTGAAAATSRAAVVASAPDPSVPVPTDAAQEDEADEIATLPPAEPASEGTESVALEDMPKAKSQPQAKSVTVAKARTPAAAARTAPAPAARPAAVASPAPVATPASRPAAQPSKPGSPIVRDAPF